MPTNFNNSYYYGNSKRKNVPEKLPLQMQPPDLSGVTPTGTVPTSVKPPAANMPAGNMPAANIPAANIPTTNTSTIKPPAENVPLIKKTLDENPSVLKKPNTSGTNLSSANIPSGMPIPSMPASGMPASLMPASDEASPFMKSSMQTPWSEEPQTIPPYSGMQPLIMPEQYQQPMQLAMMPEQYYQPIPAAPMPGQYNQVLQPSIMPEQYYQPMQSPMMPEQYYQPMQSPMMQEQYYKPPCMPSVQMPVYAQPDMQINVPPCMQNPYMQNSNMYNPYMQDPWSTGQIWGYPMPANIQGAEDMEKMELEEATAAKSDPPPILSNNPPVTTIVLFKELTGYPNYGNPSGNADILYTGNRGVWTLGLQPFLFVPGQLTARLVVRAVLDDHASVPVNRYSARITVNDTVVHDGPVPLEHGVPAGGRFNNWRELTFNLRNVRRVNRVVIVNTSTAGDNDWIAIDWMEIRFSPR